MASTRALNGPQGSGFLKPRERIGSRSVKTDLITRTTPLLRPVTRGTDVVLADPTAGDKGKESYLDPASDLLSPTTHQVSFRPFPGDRPCLLPRQSGASLGTRERERRGLEGETRIALYSLWRPIRGRASGEKRGEKNVNNNFYYPNYCTTFYTGCSVEDHRLRGFLLLNSLSYSCRHCQ